MTRHFLWQKLSGIIVSMRICRRSLAMYQTETRQDSRPTTAFPVHDEAYDAFMMLPPYTGTREGMGSSIGENGPNHGFRAFA